jgi:hypothetical protein
VTSAFREAQKAKKSASTSASAGASSGKVKIPARPRADAAALPAVAQDAGGDSEIDEELLAELQESEGVDEDDGMDVDDAER